MAVNYAEKYSQIVDERFKIGALTSALVNYAYDWVGVSTVEREIEMICSVTVRLM